MLSFVHKILLVFMSLTTGKTGIKYFFNNSIVTEDVLHQAVIAQYDYGLTDQDLIPTMDRISPPPLQFVQTSSGTCKASFPIYRVHK
jgi:hypothetical protein